MELTVRLVLLCVIGKNEKGSITSKKKKLFVNEIQTQLVNTGLRTTSFPGSLEREKRDPGCSWSRATQNLGGDKKFVEGRAA